MSLTRVQFCLDLARRLRHWRRSESRHTVRPRRRKAARMDVRHPVVARDDRAARRHGRRGRHRRRLRAAARCRDGAEIMGANTTAFGDEHRELQGRIPTRRAAADPIPLLRGLMQLAASMAPLARGRGVARPRERLFVLARSDPLSSIELPSRLEFPADFARRRRSIDPHGSSAGATTTPHGAEHRAIATAADGLVETAWTSRCGRACFPADVSGTDFDRARRCPVTALFDRVAPSIITPTVTGALVASSRSASTHGALEGGAASVRSAQGPVAARPGIAAADDEGAVSDG